MSLLHTMKKRRKTRSLPVSSPFGGSFSTRSASM